MAIAKPTVPKGTRDFGPAEMARRTYIFDTIRSAFRLYGFQPIETPSMENLGTLTGKYGDEGDQLIFKVLNSGDYLAKADAKKLEARNSKQLLSDISEKALRYDLTVPFARYVVMNQHNITFPFKRYQIQPVWRADRPQKGRYREFYQCDADVVGSDSLLNEIELVQIIDDVFSKLNIPVTLKINNRKILTGIAETIDASDKLTDITVAIDKLDKIGPEGIEKELREKGLDDSQIAKLNELILIKQDRILDGEIVNGTLISKPRPHNNLSILKSISSEFGESINIQKGVEELSFIFNAFEKETPTLKLNTTKLEFDIALARGLSYYTGAIFEVKVDKSRCSSEFTGSISGGGRYDDLTGIFGLPGVSGVGISFGADRIYDVLEELKLFPEMLGVSTQVMFVNFGPGEEQYCLKAATRLRAEGINTELYPEAAKMKKQMGYADDKRIPYVILVGSNEMQGGQLTLKNMRTGEQEQAGLEEIINKIKKG